MPSLGNAVYCVVTDFLKISIKYNLIMSKGKNQHVIPHNGEWAIKAAGNDKVTKVVETQKEAIEIAREISINQESELFIHRKNGQIRERNTYGQDDYPPKG